jgi:hypothetical protein
VEYAALEWVDWLKHRRLPEPIGNVPRVELELAYDRRQDEWARAAGLNTSSLLKIRGGSGRADRFTIASP